jgi:hypothetical protein
MAKHSPRSSALSLPETLHHILLQLDTNRLLTPQLVCKDWYFAISTSTGILHETLFPSTPTSAAPYAPNAIGTSEFFTLDNDQDPVTITKNDHLSSIQYPIQNRSHPEIFYHLHLEREMPTRLPALSNAQRNLTLLPTSTRIQVIVTNWWQVAPSRRGVAPELWTKFTVDIKPRSVEATVHLIEKIGMILQVLSQQEVKEDLASEFWKLQLSTSEMDILFDGGNLKVDFAGWWNIMANEYYG